MNWLEIAYQKALKLTKLKQNWDDEDGKPMSLNFVEEFNKVLLPLKDLNIIDYFYVIPFSGGKAFQIEWRYKKNHQNHYLEIEFHETGEINFLYSNRTKAEEYVIETKDLGGAKQFYKQASTNLKNIDFNIFKEFLPIKS